MPGKQPEVRLTQNTIIVLALLAVLVFGFFRIGGVGGLLSLLPGAADEGTPDNGAPDNGAPTPPPVIPDAPAIEKTKLYLSTIDFAEDEDGVDKLIAGTAKIVKAGNLIETVTTTTSAGAASTAEFNGGDAVEILGDASGYYADTTGPVVVTETLQPFQAVIKEGGNVTLSLIDDTLTEVAQGALDTSALLNVSISLDTGEQSDVYTMKMERPGVNSATGGDRFYRFCALAMDYDDDEVQWHVRGSEGTFSAGITDLVDDMDRLDTAGYEAYWDYGLTEIRGFNDLKIDMFVKAKKTTINPAAGVNTITILDCEKNLQSGTVVDTAEDASDSDVGQADMHLYANIS